MMSARCDLLKPSLQEELLFDYFTVIDFVNSDFIQWEPIIRKHHL
jgi:hypothetical protein